MDNKGSLNVLAMTIMMLTLFVSSAQARIIEVQEAQKPPFNVVFEPKQQVYHTGERIQFTFKSEKRCYLYLFSIDEENGVGYMILPNKLQQYHKYKAGIRYTVPERPLEFFADEPGVENIVMVASRKKLDLDFGSYVRFKDFFQTKSETMIKDLKALSIRPRQEKADMVMLETEVIVKSPEGEASDLLSEAPAATPQEPAARAEESTARAASVATFVSSDKTTYGLGDMMKLTYGADEPGVVYLYMITPDGKQEFLLKQRVDGKRFYQQKARVTEPIGEHALYAVYDKQGDLDENSVALPATLGKTAEKGLALIDETRPEHFSKYSFTVTTR